jgi:hypothetical protein
VPEAGHDPGHVDVRRQDLAAGAGDRAAPRQDGDDLVLAQLDAVADGGRLGQGAAQRAGDGHQPVAVRVPDGVATSVLCDDARHAREPSGGP